MRPSLVVGLGNPGPDYKDTRHNVGFWVADALADRLGASFAHEHDALVAAGTHRGRDLRVAKPLTYVNRSGDAVAALCRQYRLSADDVLVVVDDLHLSVGTLRLRPKGSSGGHNGLAHVAERLETTAFSRLRIGIGSDFADGEQVDYVLAPFTPEQRPHIDGAIADAVDALLTVVEADLDTAMNQYN